MGHYPSEQVLEIIKNWDLTKKPLKELLDLIEIEWEFAENYFHLTIRKANVYLQLHTAGWSGNEDIYYAFEKIKFIGYFWTKSERGGHYYYQFSREFYEKGMIGLKEQGKNPTEKLK